VSIDRRPLAAELASYESDPRLLDEPSLYARARAIDFADLLGEVSRVSRDPEIGELSRRAETLRERLTAIDDSLFSRVRADLLSGSWTAAELRRELDRFTAYRPESSGVAHHGFDGLDLLLNGVLGTDPAIDPIDPPEPEMVHYEPVPARVILDLVDHVGLTRSDVFNDLGSGLGRVVFLVNLLTGVRCRGVEIRSDLCAAARRVAEQFRLAAVEIIAADAREADYRDGTVFFMFTPFRGALLQAVLERLHTEASQRPIIVCTYGSCTRRVFEAPWLEPVRPDANDDYKLAIFRSRPG
jgi:hypothetical protein